MKLIMENWKRFIAEETGLNMKNMSPKEVYIDALYLYYSVIYGYYRAYEPITYLKLNDPDAENFYATEEGRERAEDEVERILVKAKDQYTKEVKRILDQVKDRADRAKVINDIVDEDEIETDVQTSQGRGHDKDLGDVEDYLKKAFLEGKAGDYRINPDDPYANRNFMGYNLNDPENPYEFADLEY
tara:strand:- start:931 stop:1488 length:558 start_codon:yes stop_codon:yes gene_type:complete